MSRANRRLATARMDCSNGLLINVQTESGAKTGYKENEAPHLAASPGWLQPEKTKVVL
jgi:hypothetical protein